MNYTASDFGPNGEEVAALIERARNLTPVQVEELGGAWNAVPDSSLDAAWDAVQDAGRHPRKVAAWYAFRDAGRDAWRTAQDADWAAARYATRSAACAVVVRDRISEEHFNTLYGPWSSVMEAGK